MSKGLIDIPDNTWLLTLAMDGGGIYGLFAAIWLKQLCLKDPDFLAPRKTCQYYFAGTSAGGVTALLLARHENPRDACLPGPDGRSELENFWRDARMYTNERNPVDAALSNMHLTAWLGEEDCLELLDAYLGPTKLSELHHRVVISTYNWHGDHPLTFPPRNTRRDWPAGWAPPRRPQWPPRPFSAPTLASWPSLMRPFADRLEWSPSRTSTFSHAIGAAWANMAAATQANRDEVSEMEIERRQPGPLLITNFLEDDCGAHDYDAVDIGYGAVAMPPARSIRGGIGDGAIFTPNPAVNASTAILQQLFQNWERRGRKTADGSAPDRSMHALLVGLGLWRMKMLSMGNGADVPPYWIRDANFGAVPWNMGPVNPWVGGFNPQHYLLNQPIQDAEATIRTLLGDEDYFRINPPLMPIPPGSVLTHVRKREVRERLIHEIETRANGDLSKETIDEAAVWIDQYWHTDEPPKTLTHLAQAIDDAWKRADDTK